MKKPSLLKRAKIAGSMLWGSPWEGANQSPNRSTLNVGAPADFKHELTEWGRSELVRKMRYLHKNDGQLREYVNAMALYAAPVRPQSLVEDDEWRKEAEALYADRVRIADVTERFTGDQVQGIISKKVDIDGELVCLKVIDKATGLPRVQMIESHRIGDFGRSDTIDGIKVNSKGKPTHMNLLLDSGKSKLIPHRRLMHIFDPESPSAYRGFPTLAHSINHRLDADEICAIEKKGVKDSLEITRLITMMGEDVDEDDVREMLGQDDDGDLTAAEQTDPKAMQRILGGKTFHLQDGEKVDSFQSNRPHPGFTAFMDHLERQSALGGLPFEFHNLGGINSVAGRIVLERVKRISQRRSQLILDRYLRQDWFFRIGLAIDAGELKPIKNWHKIAGGFPAQATVDAGRNDESLRRSIDKGLISPSDATQERGKSFAEVIETTAQDIKTVDQIAERYELDPAQLFEFNSNKPTSGSLSGTAPSAKPGVEGAKAATPEEEAMMSEAHFASLKAQFDAYGVGVRAGVITPQKDDEDAFRAVAQFPKMSKDAAREWRDEKGVRRPITITPKGGAKPAFGSAPAKEDPKEE